jgi:threonine dehydrogenase-like Zn-dependent dehydrogenase
MTASRSLVRAAAPGVGHRVVPVLGPPPQPPGDRWCLVRVTLSGICGSDLAGLAQPGETAAPHPVPTDAPVLGHEVVGVVAEAAAGGTPVGTRVVVHPLVPCAARALPPCPSCRAGWYGQCRSFWTAGAPWGKSLGFSSRLGGGWGDHVAAHHTMLRPVPEELPDRAAVLAEPLSVAIAGLRLVHPVAADDLVVVGGGTLGLLTAYAAGSVRPGVRRVLMARHGFQVRAARALGVEAVLGADASATDELAARLGFAPARLGDDRLLLDGPGLVVDAGGTPESLARALAVVGIGGTVLTLGNPESCPDLRALWLKRVTLVGHLEHAAAPDEALRPGQHPDSLSEAVRLLTAAPDLGNLLVTHVLPLDEHAAAIAIARHKPRHGAIKVVMRP